MDQRGTVFGGELQQVAGDVYRMTFQAPPPVRPAVTHGLPRDVAGFTGREAELRWLLDAATPGRVLAVHTVDGMPGVGKTALVTHAAHRLADRFPDGQFYQDLHAHAPGRSAADPVDVLAVLLTGLGIDPRNLPPTLKGRSDLWRDRLAGRRVLLVLDDAADHAQIRPLLPAGPGCLTLVTSRRRLVALDGAHPLPLAPLADDEAVELFLTTAHRHPADRADLAAVTEAVGLCGRLPLAIVLLAGRLAHKERWSLAEFTADFAQAHDRVGELTGGDRAVRTAFTLSYDELTAPQRRLFRYLSLHPGPDVDAPAAAALAGIPPDQARHGLEALYTDHLLDEVAPGRYRLHDLLRAYARTLAHAKDSPRERALGVERVLDHYRRAAHAADRWISRVRRPGAAAPPHSTLPEFTEDTAALSWLRAHRATLLACLDVSVSPAYTAELTGALAAFLLREGPWPQAATLHERAVTAARSTGDRTAQANALHDLGVIRRMRDEHAKAADIQRRALCLYRLDDDALGQANSLYELGNVLQLSGDHAQGARLHQQALDLYRQVDDPLGQANTVNQLGVARRMLDAYAEAADLHQRALELYEGIGDRLGQANALYELGAARRLQGDFPEAARLHQRALDLYRHIGDRLGQAQGLNELGLVRRTEGAHAEAARLYQAALDVFRQLGDRLGQGNSLHELGVLRRLEGAYAESARLHERALNLFLQIGEPLGQANVLNDLGVVRSLGDGAHEEAARLHQRALGLYERIDDRQGQAEAWHHLGALLARSGREREALTAFDTALRLARETHSPLDEAHALEGSARCRVRLGDRAAGVAELRRAVGLYERLRVAEAGAAAAYLAGLDAEGPGADG
ncbi:ATP-binding protein [Streptomyces sp. G45]|uniref:ATP-binding protein n=1 Tax=Streptomyces sp. G45 TaxID=3406627 RepID=UPI003C24AF3E